MKTEKRPQVGEKYIVKHNDQIPARLRGKVGSLYTADPFGSVYQMCLMIDGSQEYLLSSEVDRVEEGAEKSEEESVHHNAQPTEFGNWGKIVGHTKDGRRVLNYTKGTPKGSNGTYMVLPEEATADSVKELALMPDGEYAIRIRDTWHKIEIIRQKDFEYIAPNPAKPHDPALFPNEEAVQQAAIRELKAAGYEVLQTTVRVRACEKCGAVPYKARYGATAGVPDLMVRKKGWPEGVWRAIEIKGPKTKLSQEQVRLEAEKAITIARSPEEAKSAADRTNAQLIVSGKPIVLQVPDKPIFDYGKDDNELVELIKAIVMKYGVGPGFLGTASLTKKMEISKHYIQGSALKAITITESPDGNTLTINVYDKTK